MTENQPVAAPAATETLYCAYHPGRETLLRCNRCGNPICYECAVLTEVGYRCKQCVRQQQAVYYTGKTSDLVVAVVVSALLGGVVGALAFMFLGILGLFFALIIAFFVGPAAGGMIAEAVRQSVGRRRSRYLNIVAIVASLVGMLVGIALVFSIGRGVSFSTALGFVPNLVIQRWYVLLFAFMSSSTIFWRLR